MRKTLFAAAVALLALSNASVFAAPADYKDPLDPSTLAIIRSQFTKVMELANRQDINALHEMFWQSPSALIVAKGRERLRRQGGTGQASGATRQSIKNYTTSLHLGRSYFGQTFRDSRLLV